MRAESRGSISPLVFCTEAEIADFRRNFAAKVAFAIMSCMAIGAHSAEKPSFWRRHKGFRVAAFAVAAVAALLAAFLAATNAVVVGSASERIVSSDEAADSKADAIVVLGALVYPDGTPSPILQDRLDNAIDLYKAGAAPKLIMSGDHGTVSYNEVQGMKQYAVDQGVPADDVFCDHAGFSTYESMYRAKHVFGAERVIVSTQTYHLYRALYDAAGLGLEAVGVPSDFRTFREQFMWDIREIPARSKDLVKALVGAPPTFGGDPIDLKQSGNVTDG